MGGKGGGGNSFKPPGQAATGQDPFAGGQSRPQQQQSLRRPQMPVMQQTSSRGQQRSSGGDTRIGADQLTNLYAPPVKQSPTAPMPARIGVRAERQAYNPKLAIAQKDIDRLYGYGPTYAISEKKLNKLYGGSGNNKGSLLGGVEGEDYDSITGEIF